MKTNLRVYKFFNSYGFSYYFNKNCWGNRTPRYLQPVAKVLHKIGVGILIK